ncbi:hypothetical protein MES5069_310052 [Mesorhizobium escarrei]|uniref:Uncharacterized protein n=1 Tax=Mesorhizobium escarrei TaxID=666018 RepID=A0ABN8JZC6_9HYPH|nr:hypothetical protein MES5069_310052 [Mesorhizobium escarrei]
MKDNGSILVRSPDAVMAAKGAIQANLQYSSLVFAKDTVVVGALTRMCGAAMPTAYWPAPLIRDV